MGSISINDSELDSLVISPKKTAVVFFWANWDGSCKAFMPTFEQSADENQNKLLFYKLDVGGNPTTPTKYNVQAVPTVIIFKEGQIFNRTAGLMTKQKLNDFIGKS